MERLCQTLLGQKWSSLSIQLIALYQNIVAWLISSFLPSSFQTKRHIPQSNSVCISIPGPGGLDQLQYIDIPADSVATVGYNVPGFKSPFVSANHFVLPEDCVLVRTDYFSINYADVCIRWGLYESAIQYVGWPIVPGFDFSGTVIQAGSKSKFQIGDKVFGVTLFGAYSSRIVVPARQIRKIPKDVPGDVAAAIPAVSLTALYALVLAGQWPQRSLSSNKAVLIHSAAGGVGLQLIQLAKHLGLSPIVAVVGSKHKVSTCKQYGADIVIDKSNFDLWIEARRASPKGYIAVFDANGADTLQESFNHLSSCGRLITYGFHSNLPKASDLLSPWKWVTMIASMFSMPKFDPMQMVLESKGVLGFNLSFFSEEVEAIGQYMNQIVDLIESKQLSLPQVTAVDMKNIAEAHKLIQSGMSIGKIVVRCPKDE